MYRFEVIDSGILFENPDPKERSLQGYFPNIIELDENRLLAAFSVGGSMESIDGTTMLSLSRDRGRSWEKPRRLIDDSRQRRPASDSCKLTNLEGSRVAAFGYRFFRDDPDMGIGNPETGGVLDDEVIIMYSEDGGESFSDPETVPVSFREPVEASAPMYVLSNGDWITPTANFLRWDGSTESGTCGRMLRSEDEGRTWDDSFFTMKFPGEKTCIWEQRACELDPGRVLVIAWVEDLEKGIHYPNQAALSIDYGRTFGEPISTGVMGQAASIHSIGEGKVLSLHCIRRDSAHPGILACIAEIRENRWHEISRNMLWAPKPFSPDAARHDVFAYLKFGQPSALELRDGDWLMSFWYEEEGQSRIFWRRFRMAESIGMS